MSESTAALRKHPLRVAIVDDHRMMLDGIIAHFTARRSVIDTDTDIDGDIDIVISELTWPGLLAHPKFPVDVVVLDLNLNDGVAIGAKIRALTAAGIHTVVISSHSDAASIHGVLAAGAGAFVPKTDAADELITAVHTVATGGQYLSSRAAITLGDVRSNRNPGLGPQEQRALTLYATGRSIREVADEMATTVETIKSYLKRARRKYRQIDIDVGTKILLRRRGVEEGWLTSE